MAANVAASVAEVSDLHRARPVQIPDGNAFFEWRREQFPFFEHKICLTHASVSPLPARASRALIDYARRLSVDGQFDYVSEQIYRSAKERIAALIGNGARADEVAMAGSTSHALGLVATSFPWKSGDNCVVVDGDFPANVVTWKNLEITRGVEIRMVPYRENSEWTWPDFEPLLDKSTRLVSVSAVNFLSGCPLDLKTLGAELHRRGIALCVDAIQAFGAVAPDFSEADFICADAHKWMLGPLGAAFAWFSPRYLSQMRPQILGWLAIEGRDNWFSYSTDPFPTAERFEPGARNFIGTVGMEASLALIGEVGIETIQKRVTQLRDYGAAKVAATGAQILWRGDQSRASGIFSFRCEALDMNALNAQLDERFALSLRADRAGALWIRVSPHFMNCQDDLDELAAAVAASSARL